MNNNDLIRNLILIALAILAIFIAYKWIKYNIKNKPETITAFTGGLGSGKTLLTNEMRKKLYKKNCRKWRKCCIKIWFKNTFLRKDIEYPPKPQVYSNIPLVVGRKRKQVIFARKLKWEHLLLQEKIEPGSIVVIDEVGAFADQFRFNDPNVRVTFNEFVRLFRHYLSCKEGGYSGYLVVNDQCSENINLYIRRRINVVHNLSNCLVIWRLCFYFERMINISEEIKTIDQRSQENDKENDTQNNMCFKFKFLWSKKDYDTYCYSERYSSVPYGENKEHEHMKTNDLLACPECDTKSLKGFIHALTNNYKKGEKK